MQSSGGGVGRGGFGYTSGSPGDPTIDLGSINNVVGGDMRVTVGAPGSATFSSVSWEIPNAEQVQPYSNQKGSTTPLANPIASNVGGSSSSIQFFWDNTTGAHTIKVTVTYAAPFSGMGTASASVSIVAPTVNSLALDSYPLVWRDSLGGGFPGFTLYGAGVPPTPTGSGLSPAAEVTLPADAMQSGNYAFIQMASFDYVVTNPQTGNHTLITNGLVLDNNPKFKGPTGQGWLAFESWMSDRVAPGATVSNTAFAPYSSMNAAVDAINIIAPTATANGNPDPANEANLILFQVTDWLVYRSGNGIWVGIGKTGNLSVTGHEKLAGTPPVWSPVGALTPAAFVVIPGGGAGPTFVTWGDFMTDHDFSPPYRDPAFPR